MLYVDFSIKSSWYVANSMQGLNMTQTVIKGARKLKLSNGVEVGVKVVRHSSWRLSIYFE
jgi:hypothetical protein